eukprot:gene6281-6520_t
MPLYSGDKFIKKASTTFCKSLLPCAAAALPPADYATNQPSISRIPDLHQIMGQVCMLLWSLDELQQLRCQIPDVKLSAQSQAALHTQVVPIPGVMINTTVTSLDKLHAKSSQATAPSLDSSRQEKALAGPATAQALDEPALPSTWLMQERSNAAVKAAAGTVQPKGVSSSSAELLAAMYDSTDYTFAACDGVQMTAGTTPGLPVVNNSKGKSRKSLELAGPVTKLATCSTEVPSKGEQQAACASSTWDASWGDVLSVKGSDRAAPWWRCGPALAMLSGAALQQQPKQQQGQAKPSPAMQAPATAVDALPATGAALLDELLLRDLQLASDGLVLPVPLLPDITQAPLAACSLYPLQDLLDSCCYKRQPSSHLELFFDWSLLQPLHTRAHSRSSNRQAGHERCSTWQTGHTTTPTAIPQGKAAAGPAMEPPLMAQVPSSGSGSAPGQRVLAVAAADSSTSSHTSCDVLTWIAAHRSMCPSLATLQQTPQSAAICTSAATEAGVASLGADAAAISQRSKAYLSHVLQKSQDMLQAGATASFGLCISLCKVAASGPQGRRSFGSNTGSNTASVADEIPHQVAAAAAAWRAKHLGQPKLPSSPTAAGGTAVTAAARPEAIGMSEPLLATGVTSHPTSFAAPALLARQSDMAFFLELQKGAARPGSKRIAADVLDGGQAVSAPPQDGKAAAASAAGADWKRFKVSVDAVEVSQGCSAQPSSGLARDRRVLGQQLQDEEAQQGQQQLTQIAAATAELALTGAARVEPDKATNHSMLEQQTALVAQISAPLPPFLLQLLLTLQANKLSVLKAVQETAPGLRDAAPWDDSAPQQLLDRYQAAAPLTANLKEQAKQSVALVLLSQAAACLLHYGVRVAHLFLQHALQKVPAIATSCGEAAVALAAAHSAVEHLPTTASGSAGRLAQSSMAAPAVPKGGKVLLVAEAKAFFSLFPTLSSAGYPGVQLDKGKQLPVESPASASAHQAWQAAVSAALSGAVTPSMEPAPATGVAAVAQEELPLVLHRGRSSIFRRRRSLYEALLCQLEVQAGFLLVERLLQGSAAGADSAGGFGSAAPAAVDVVLSPAACLCVFDECKLPLEPIQALKLLLSILRSLSAAYDTVFAVLELPDQFLQQLLRHAAVLQQAAISFGVHLQLLCSFTAAQTQDQGL